MNRERLRELGNLGGDTRDAEKDFDPLETALAEFRAARGQEPGSAETLMNLGVAYLNLSQPVEAVAALREAIRLRPSLAEAHRNLGHALDKLGCFDEAIAEFRAATRIRPGDPAVENSLADALARQSEFEQAPAQQKGLLDDHPSMVEIEQAPAGYVEAASLQAGPTPKKVDVKEAFADSAFETTEDKRVELLPKNGLWTPDPASAAEPQSAPFVPPESRLVDGERSSFPGPTTAAGAYRRALRYSKIRAYDLAIADFNEAIRLDPGMAGAYTGRGYVWLQKQEYAKAIADYSDALRLDPKEINALNGRAWLWSTCPDLRFRDGKKAVESATKACELTRSKDGNLVDTLAAAYAETGDFEQAVKKQSDAIRLIADEREKAKFRVRLKLYEQKKPYRLTTQKPPVGELMTYGRVQESN